MRHLYVLAALGVVVGFAGPARAQRAGDNAVTSAQDAFGRTVGAETIGLYSTTSARGFSPVQAGNIRIEGLYWDRQGSQGNYDRIFKGSAVHVGLSAQSYPFPAPTGIADFSLRIPGDKPVASFVSTVGPYDQFGFELDTQTPIVAGKLSLGAGVGYTRVTYDWGSHSFLWTGAGIVNWRPSARVNIVAFYNHSSVNDWEVRPFPLTSGAFYPPKFNRLTYFGQPYNDWEENTHNFGAITRASLVSNWTLRFGAFRSIMIRPEDALIFYPNGDRNGFHDVNFVFDPRQRFASYSGQARLSGVFSENARRHTVHFDFRGRNAKRKFGGGVVINVGRYPLGERVTIPRPQMNFGPSSHDHIRQGTGGIAYELLWSGVGELSAGLQKTEYTQTVEKPGLPATRTHSAPWLPNATLAAHLTDKLAVYTSYTKGLEESPTAPDNSTNRGTALPAILTRQVDGGIRYAISPSLKLVAGIFQLKKPFIDRDPANLYRVVGNLRHRGVEISLAGQAAEGLTIVTGAVFLQARASGILVDQGSIGHVPGGRQPIVFRLNTQYAPPMMKGFSFDSQFDYTKEGFLNGQNTLKLPPHAQIGVGGRYRFTAFGAPATVRVQMLNLTNAWGWNSGGGATAFFQYLAPRRFIGSLTVDF